MAQKFDTNTILAAIKEMDHDDDSQWTAEGLPALPTIESLLGAAEGSLTREVVTTAAPDFKRISDADFDAPAAQAEPEQPEPQVEDKPDLLVDGQASDEVVEGDESEDSAQEDDETAEQLDARIAEARAEAEHLDAVAVDARNEHAKAVRALDALILKKDSRFKVKPADAISDYVQSQMRLRAERAGAHGVYRSPIDQAMRARKRSVPQITRVG